jgi:uncharacterized protein
MIRHDLRPGGRPIGNGVNQLDAISAKMVSLLYDKVVTSCNGISMFANTGYEVIVSATIAGFSAQLIKFTNTLLLHRQLNFRLLVQTGGMPSSHSATMTGMATSVGLIAGFDSVVFSVALGVALVVMYDAAGVRRAAGKMAGILNKLVEEVYIAHNPGHVHERLRELLGHTPIEVMGGFLLGVLTAICIHLQV